MALNQTATRIIFLSSARSRSDFGTFPNLALPHSVLPMVTESTHSARPYFITPSIFVPIFPHNGNQAISRELSQIQVAKNYQPCFQDVTGLLQCFSLEHTPAWSQDEHVPSNRYQFSFTAFA